MISQMTVALLHSNRQLKTERDGDTEKGCQKSVLQQKTTDDAHDECHAHPLFLRSGLNFVIDKHKSRKSNQILFETIYTQIQKSVPFYFCNNFITISTMTFQIGIKDSPARIATRHLGPASLCLSACHHHQ